MSASNHSAGMSAHNKDLLVLWGAGFCVAGAFTGVIHLGNALTPTGESYAVNPVALALELLQGQPCPASALPIGIGVGVAAAAAAVAYVLRRPTGTTIDDKARFFASGRNLAPLLEKARIRDTHTLHPGAEIPPGQRIGLPIRGKQWLLQGWRDLSVNIFGTGQGKTSSQCVRKAVLAPGAAVFTSNKVDGVAEILAGRHGTNAYLFDPQGIYRDNPVPDFTFDLLTHITTPAEAKNIAGIFAASTRTADSRGEDAQFDNQGRDLLAGALLAASLAGERMSTVFEWLTTEEGDTVVAILRQHRHLGTAQTVQGITGQPARTRGSVYATAQRMAAALSDDDLLRWTDRNLGVRQFDPEAFVTSRDTLILLSKEGEGSGGAILTCLVAVICRHAEKTARRNGGRLRVPLVLELDECANIVRWPELPKQYSYFGSLGLAVSTYFQSHAQGVKAFGRDEFTSMWEAASMRVYGGGSGDSSWLKSLSDLIGLRDERTTSTSTGRGRNTRSISYRKVPVMTVDELSSLPRWRAVVFTSGTRPALVRTVPWFDDADLRERITPHLPARPAQGHTA